MTKKSQFFYLCLLLERGNQAKRCKAGNAEIETHGDDTCPFLCSQVSKPDRA